MESEDWLWPIFWWPSYIPDPNAGCEYLLIPISCDPKYTYALKLLKEMYNYYKNHGNNSMIVIRVSKGAWVILLLVTEMSNLINMVNIQNGLAHDFGQLLKIGAVNMTTIDSMTYRLYKELSSVFSIPTLKHLWLIRNIQ